MTEIIRHEQADVIFAGGSEAAIVPIALAGMDMMNAAFLTRNDDPQAATSFRSKRDGCDGERSGSIGPGII
jgi:3-oxoacyl-[acyl-carrier-protein] synthase II